MHISRKEIHWGGDFSKLVMHYADCFIINKKIICQILFNLANNFMKKMSFFNLEEHL